MDRIFMDEYYEHLRADNIEAFSKERNDAGGACGLPTAPVSTVSMPRKTS